jgi:hypothetical protein
MSISYQVSVLELVPHSLDLFMSLGAYGEMTVWACYPNGKTKCTIILVVGSLTNKMFL